MAHPDLAAFEWFVHLIADLEYELYRGRESGAVANRNYCEIHIYVTRAPKLPEAPRALRAQPARDGHGALPRVFTTDLLFRELQAPRARGRVRAAHRGSECGRVG